jgi:GTP-binding protein
VTNETRPLVAAISGRPNAGKSTLFNRLLRRRQAIVHDTPGVTRDENRAELERDGRRIELVDTGGIEEMAEGALGERVQRRTYEVLGDVDVIVHLLDGQGGVSPADHEVARRLRAIGKPVVFAVNKIDQARHESRLLDFASLGAEDLVPVSAAHGRGLGELWERVVELGGPGAEVEEEAEDEEGRVPSGPPRVALIGRPNVGKSSLLNQFVGYDRAIVDSVPGTTRDSLDVRIERGGQSWILVDTAGLRRPSKIVEDIEGYAAGSSLRALAASEVAVLVLDATVGVTDQDMRLADLAWRRGRGLVVAVNKMDLAPKLASQQCHDEIANRLPQWPPLPLVQVSAMEGTGLRNLLRAVDIVSEGYRRRIPTPRLNELVQAALEEQPPPMVRHRPVKVRYAAQVRRAPQEIALFVNRRDAFAESYQRYLRHRLREEFGLVGVPLQLHLRARPPKNAEGVGASGSPAVGRSPARSSKTTGAVPKPARARKTTGAGAKPARSRKTTGAGAKPARSSKTTGAGAKPSRATKPSGPGARLSRAKKGSGGGGRGTPRRAR